MTAAPVPTNFASLDTATEALMDATTDAINFLRSPPRAKLNRLTSQTIPTSTDTAIIWTSETYDSVNGHDNSTNPSRYTAVYDGLYTLKTSIPYLLNSDDFKIEVRFMRSDGVEYGTSAEYKAATGTTACVSTSADMHLLTGEYVEVITWHNRGSNATIDGSFHGSPHFDIRWVSAI